jgi:hypothetical protein
MSDDSEKGGWLPVISAALNFVPFIGTAKGVVEAVTGEDLLTGDELSAGERALGILPIGGALAKGASAATDVASIIVRGSDAVNAAERADELADIAKGAKGADQLARGIDTASDGWQLGIAMGEDIVAERRARDAKSHESGNAAPARTPINSGGGDGPMEPGPVPPLSDAPPGIARDTGPDTPGSRPEVVGVPLGPEVPVAPPSSPNSGITGPGAGEEICVPEDGLDAPATPGPTTERASDIPPSAGVVPAPASVEVPADPGAGLYTPAVDELPLQQGQYAPDKEELSLDDLQPVNADAESANAAGPSTKSALEDFFETPAPTKRHKG